VQVDPAEVDVSGGVARARLKALGPEGTVQVRASVEGMATTQSLRVASPPRLELSLAADPSELVTPSETVTVTVSLKNVGKRAVQGVRVACQVPFAATFIMGATQKEGTEVEYVLPDALKAGQTAEGALRLRMQIPATARETATLRCQVSAEGMDDLDQDLTLQVVPAIAVAKRPPLKACPQPRDGQGCTEIKVDRQQRLAVEAKDKTGLWLRLSWAPGEDGWVRVENVNTTDLSAVPVE